ncbi:hypothetical protein LguiA_019549 [Lonicera macranthoides]
MNTRNYATQLSNRVLNLLHNFDTQLNIQCSFHLLYLVEYRRMKMITIVQLDSGC